MHNVHGDLAGVDLNLVVALDALLAERHVTRAAARLGLTQSAASHALARLRDLFGDPLLLRGPGGTMVATPLASRLAPQVRKVLDELAGVLRGESFDPATARHAFHVGTGDYAEAVLLPQLAQRLGKLAPGIDLWIHTFPDWGDPELATGAVDLVIAPPRGKARAAGTYEKVLFDESFTCLLRAGHPYAKGKLTLARYCELSHLFVAPRGTPGGVVDDALALAGRSRRVAIAVPHFLAVPGIVASTDLVATLPRRIADHHVDRRRIARLSPPVEIPRFQIALAWHERNHADARHRWLREQVQAVAAEVA